MQENSGSDILIVGGGVIGLFSAYYLSTAGYAVRVIEKSAIGAGASQGNCGLLLYSDLPPLCQPGVVREQFGRMLQKTSPLYIKPEFDPGRMLWLLRFAAKCSHSHLRRALPARESLVYLSKQLYQELMDKERLACDWQRKGVLIVYKDQADMDKYEKTNALLKPYGMGARPLSRTELLKIEPSLHGSVCGAWLHEHDSHLRPEKLLQAMKELVVRKGVQVETDCALTGFESRAGRIEAARTTRGPLTARHFILAAGAWTPLLTRMVGFRLPIQPAKGYSLTLPRPEACPRIPCYFHEPRVVATPWPDGLRLGGTLEFSGYNDRIEPARLAQLKKAGAEYLRRPPAAARLEAWTCVRPMSADDLPFIGKLPGFANLIVAAGHGMMGMTLATGTGRVVADLIGGREPGIDLRPFRPGRF